eukprot:TRINITY_DN0_c14_g1_i8.p1 TRINITY_DN0_c14_g1~~TRINITY_DN0_c14_g1_i8.p1  ORF type:complete len:1096 (-),score=264.69 TRINITY_DN0_c14_g1_i8:50-3337(-)
MRKLIVFTLLLALFAFAFAASASSERRRRLTGVRRIHHHSWARRLGGVRRLWIRRSGRRYIVWSQVCSCRRIYRSVRVNSRFGRRLRVFGRAAKVNVSRRGGLQVRRLIGNRWIRQRRPSVRIYRCIRRFRPRRNKPLVRVLIKTLQRPRVGVILRSKVTITRRANRVVVNFVKGGIRRICFFRYGVPQTRWLEQRFGRIRRGITIRARGHGRYIRCVRIIRTRIRGRVVVRHVPRVVPVTRHVRIGFRRVCRVARWRPVIRTGYIWRRYRHRWTCYVRIRHGHRYVYNKYRVVRRLPAPIARVAGNARTVRVNFGSRGVRIRCRVRGRTVRQVIRYTSRGCGRIIRTITRIPPRIVRVIRKTVIRKAVRPVVRRHTLVRQVINRAKVIITSTVRHIVVSWRQRVRRHFRWIIFRCRRGSRRANNIVRFVGRVPIRGRVVVKRSGPQWKITRQIGIRKIVIRRPFIRTQVRIIKRIIPRKPVVTPTRFRLVRSGRCLKWFRSGARPGQWVFLRKSCAPLPARVRNLCRGPNIRSIRIRLRNGQFGVRCVARNGIVGNVVSLPIVPRFVTIIRKVVKRKAPVRILRVLRPIRVGHVRVIHRKPSVVRILRTRRIKFWRFGFFIWGAWRRGGRRCVVRIPFRSRVGHRIQRTFGTIGQKVKVVTFIGKRAIVRTKGSKVVRTIRVNHGVRKTLIRVRRVPARVIERRVRFVVVRRFVVLFRRSHRRRRWVIFRRVLRTRVNFARGLRRGVLTVRRGRVQVTGVTKTGVFRRVVVRARANSRILRGISRPKLVGGRRRRTLIIRRVGRLFICSGYTRRGKPFIYTVTRRSHPALARYLLSGWKLRTATKVVIRAPRRGRGFVVTRYIGYRRIGSKVVHRRQVTGLVRFVGRRTRPLTTVRRIRFRRIGRCVVYSRFHKGRWTVFRRQCTGGHILIRPGFVRGLIYITGPRIIVRGRTRTGVVRVIRKKLTPRIVVRIRSIVPRPKIIKIRTLSLVRHIRRHRRFRARRRRGYGLPTSCFRVWRLRNRIFVSRRIRGQCRPVIRSYLRGTRRFSRLLRIAGGRLGRRRRTICRVRGRFIIVGRRGLRGGCPCKSRRRRL